MGSMFFSSSRMAFCPEDMKADYEKGVGWPHDAVEVTDEAWHEFISIPPEGKILGATSEGMPCWVDKPSPTKEEVVKQAENDKLVKISQANEFMNTRQWPGKAALQRLKGDDLAAYNKWLDYLDALMAVDTSQGAGIQWPSEPS